MTSLGQQQIQPGPPKGPIGRSLAQIAMGAGAVAMLPLAPAVSMSLAERALRQLQVQPAPRGGSLIARAYLGQ